MLTWPSILHFGTHIMMDGGDGYQMYWNIWWVRHAILTGTNPFVTSLLYYPQTPNLLIHSLHSFGGFLSIPFSYFFNDLTVFNIVVAFAFSVSGYGAYLFAKEIGVRSLPAFVGGYIFTFCNYHFAHAEGHMNLVLMQWIPFYFLYLYRLLISFRHRDGFFASVFLFLILLCDHYYFLFCSLASLIFFIWAVCYRRKEMLIRKFFSRMATFLIAVMLSLGVFVAQFLNIMTEGQNKIIGRAPDDVALYSMDLFALLILGVTGAFMNSLHPTGID